jgi:hypothetical protein
MRKPTKEDFMTPSVVTFFVLLAAGFAKFVYEAGLRGAVAYIAMCGVYCAIQLWDRRQ